MSDQLAADLASLRIDRASKPRRTWLRIILVLAIVGGVAWGAVAVGKPYLEAKVFSVEVDVTQIVSVSPAQGSVDLTATGYLVPQATAKVGAKVVGRIVKVNVKEGQAVKVNDILFELDPVDAEAAIQSGRARVAAANARILTAKANLEQGRLNYEREKKLAATGAVTQASVEDLEARMKALEALVKAAEAEAIAAQAEVQALTTGMKNLHVLAPIDGTVVSKPSTVGDVVGPGALLVDLVDMKSLLVEVDVPEGRLAMVKPNAPCEIALDAMPQERFQGEVVEVSPRINRAKATATVKVRFQKPPVELRPEMSARVSFLQKALDDAQLKEPPKTVIPSSALVEVNGNKATFVLEAGKVHIVPVKVGQAFASGFVVESGPPPGTRVVNNPPKGLQDGQSIKEKSAS